MSNQYQEIFCHVTPLDLFEPEDDSCFPPMFSVEVIASFFHILHHQQHQYGSLMEEEEEEGDYSESGCERVQKVFMVEREKLLNQETSIPTIREILTDMDVPIQDYMVDRILNFARQMMGNKRFMGRKVLRLRVEMDVPIIVNTATTSLDVDDDDDDELGFVAASNPSIEELEIVKLDEYSTRECRICLEELAAGSEARKMPCSHLYHDYCIVNWLRKSRYCPLCRFEIA